MTAPAIEHSTDKVTGVKPRNLNIEGLKDIPRSILPVPYYTFVQPSSKKATLPDGTRAPNGSFLMNDIRQVAKVLNMVILRAKRQVRQQLNDQQVSEDVVSLQLLGLDLDREGRPFIVGLPVTSFSNMGKVFEELENRDASHAWDYVVYLEGEEIKRDKITREGVKTVDYWVATAEVGEALPKEQQELAANAYQDFAVKLDRDEDEEDDLEAIAGK